MTLNPTHACAPERIQYWTDEWVILDSDDEAVLDNIHYCPYCGVKLE